MNFRYMRMILFFDLPVLTSKQRSNYRHFVKFLKKDGFIMMQESVYVKLIVNDTSVQCVKDRVSKKIPPEGKIAVLTITEKQFSNIEMLLGDNVSNIENSVERVILL